MQYKHAANANYEDLSAGRVIYHKTGYAHFPVRLASEIFMRCLEFRNEPYEKIRLYDPCCGGGYLLTVLGFLHNDKIRAIYGSDVSDDAVYTAENNVNLLSAKGLVRRKEQLEAMYIAHGKESHADAIKSIEKLSAMVQNNIQCSVYKRDILSIAEQPNPGLTADVIITDVPYGNLITWSSNAPAAINTMLDNVLKNISENAVLAICSNKQQKINNTNYKRIKKLQAGKRKIEFFIQA